MAINRYAAAATSQQFLPFISFDLSDLSYQERFSLPTLKHLKDRIKEKYQRFLAGDFKVRDVLQKPVELAQFALTLFFDVLNITLTQGIKIRLDSNIPIGCGMGSSAATVLSIIHALAHHFRVPLSADMFYRLSVEAENMQHGVSSGLDVRISLQGGCLYVEKNNIHARNIPDLSLYLVHTGTPRSTTGECVAYAARHFMSRSGEIVGNDFAAVTNHMDMALQKRCQRDVISAIRTNHVLLRTLGVVPDRVDQFIRAVEKCEGGGKICGAGSVSGDNAGMVWVMIDDVVALKTLCQQYRYEMLSVAGEPRGVHVVCS